MFRTIVACLALSAPLALVAVESAAQEKKDKKSTTGKSGTVIGVVTAKEKNAIDVKADGEEKARRYVPHWVGGSPAQGGGPDKKMLAIFAKLQIGSRIELKWEFEERLRAVEVKVLKAAPKKDEQ